MGWGDGAAELVTACLKAEEERRCRLVLAKIEAAVDAYTDQLSAEMKARLNDLASMYVNEWEELTPRELADQAFLDGLDFLIHHTMLRHAEGRTR